MILQDPELTVLVRLAQAGDEKAKNQILTDCYTFLRPMARAFEAAGGISEDLLQEAVIKISAKLSLYDPAKGSFWTWVTVVARRQMRSRLRIPPGVYQDIQRIQSAHDALLAATGTKPCPADIAVFTGIAEKQVIKLLTRLSLVFNESLDAMVEAGLEISVASEDFAAMEERSRRFAALWLAIVQLPERTRQVIFLHYFLGMPYGSNDPSQLTVAVMLDIRSDNARQIGQTGRKHLCRLMSGQSSAASRLGEAGLNFSFQEKKNPYEERFMDLWMAIYRLPELTRNVILLRYFVAFPLGPDAQLGQTAVSLLGITATEARKHLRAGRSILAPKVLSCLSVPA